MATREFSQGHADQYLRYQADPAMELAHCFTIRNGRALLSEVLRMK